MKIKGNFFVMTKKFISLNMKEVVEVIILTYFPIAHRTSRKFFMSWINLIVEIVKPKCLSISRRLFIPRLA